MENENVLSDGQCYDYANYYLSCCQLYVVCAQSFKATRSMSQFAQLFASMTGKIATFTTSCINMHPTYAFTKCQGQDRSIIQLACGYESCCVCKLSGSLVKLKNELPVMTDKLGSLRQQPLKSMLIAKGKLVHVEV